MNINKLICTGRLTKDPELDRSPQERMSANCAWPSTAWAVAARSATST